MPDKPDIEIKYGYPARNLAVPSCSGIIHGNADVLMNYLDRSKRPDITDANVWTVCRREAATHLLIDMCHWFKDVHLVEPEKYFKTALRRFHGPCETEEEYYRSLNPYRIIGT